MTKIQSQEVHCSIHANHVGTNKVFSTFLRPSLFTHALLLLSLPIYTCIRGCDRRELVHLESVSTLPLFPLSLFLSLSLSQFLLEQGAAVNSDDEVSSLTPLMAAAQCGHVEIADKLIRAGSNVNAVLKVYTYID